MQEGYCLARYPICHDTVFLLDDCSMARPLRRRAGQKVPSLTTLDGESRRGGESRDPLQLCYRLACIHLGIGAQMLDDLAQKRLDFIDAFVHLGLIFA